MTVCISFTTYNDEKSQNVEIDAGEITTRIRNKFYGIYIDVVSKKCFYKVFVTKELSKVFTFKQIAQIY